MLERDLEESIEMQEIIDIVKGKDSKPPKPKRKRKKAKSKIILKNEETAEDCTNLLCPPGTYCNRLVLESIGY